MWFSRDSRNLLFSEAKLVVKTEITYLMQGVVPNVPVRNLFYNAETIYIFIYRGYKYKLQRENALPQIQLLAGWCNSYQQSSDHPGTDNTWYQTAAPWSNHLYVLLHLHKVVSSTSQYNLKQKSTSSESTKIKKVITEMASDHRNGQLEGKFQGLNSLLVNLCFLPLKNIGIILRLLQAMSSKLKGSKRIIQQVQR